MYRINKLDMKIGKYEFDSEEQAKTKELGLGVETTEEGLTYPTHDHSVIHLGHIILEDGEYDLDGNETKAPVVSVKWHVDVCWNLNDTLDENGDLVYADHPFGWKTYSVDPQDEGVHRFYGLNYQDYKFESN